MSMSCPRIDLFQGPDDRALIGTIAGASDTLQHDAVDTVEPNQIELRWQLRCIVHVRLRLTNCAPRRVLEVDSELYTHR